MALICEDLDAPPGARVHWLLYNLAPDTTEIPEGIAAGESLPFGVRQGVNDFNRTGYTGPGPKGGAHRYRFTLFALERELAPEEPPSKRDLMRAMNGFVLARAHITALHLRKEKVGGPDRRRRAQAVA